LHCCTQEEHFYTYTNNMYTSSKTYLQYLVKMKHHISHFYNALLEYYILHQVWFIKHTENKLKHHKVRSKCAPLARTQGQKHVGHWSTASSIINCFSSPSCTMNTADTVAANQCHEGDSDVIFTSHVK